MSINRSFVPMRLFVYFLLFFVTSAFSQEANPVYTDVDTPAAFPGGNSAMLQWIWANATYPEEELEWFCSKLMVRFVVETDGRLTDIANARSCDPFFDAWAVALIAKMPNWQPALINGEPVRSQFLLPVQICFH